MLEKSSRAGRILKYSRLKSSTTTTRSSFSHTHTYIFFDRRIVCCRRGCHIARSGFASQNSDSPLGDEVMAPGENNLWPAPACFCALAWYIQKAAVLTDACCPAWSYNTCKTLLLSSSRLATTLLSLLYCCLATTLITATAVALWTWRFGFEIPFLASFALGQSEYTYLLLWWTKKYYDIAAADNATTITNTATIFNRLCQKYKSAKKWISSRFPVPDMNWSVLCAWCRRVDQEITYFSVVKQKTTTTKNFVKSKHEDRYYWGHWPS